MERSEYILLEFLKLLWTWEKAHCVLVLGTVYDTCSQPILEKRKKLLLSFYKVAHTNDDLAVMGLIKNASLKFKNWRLLNIATKNSL